MFEQRRWPREAWVPIAAGVAWLWYASSFGVLGFFFSLIPGCLLVASGLSTLLYSGDVRIPQFTALGGLLGVPLALPALWVAGPATGLLLIALSAASFIAAGMMSIRQEPHTDEVPPPIPSMRLAAEVAGDDVLLSTVTMTLPTISSEDTARIQRETRAALELYRDCGWLDKPVEYHGAPPPPERPGFRRQRVRRLEFEAMQFESGHEPREGEPGRERWLSYVPNRTAHTWLLRHDDAARPWMVCVHGFQLGYPSIDLGAFRAAWMHHKLGLNVALPVLPLHGPRRVGRRSGDGFLVGDFVQTIHAVSQAMWDIRRLLAWIRSGGGRKIGVHGLSLGGYHTALLACLDADLACAIPGIPLTDVTRAVWRHGPGHYIRYFEYKGMVYDEVSELLSVVSPLALEPLVPQERRYIYAAVADRLVPPDQPRDLWAHWGRPRIAWYQGAHTSFRSHRAVAHLVRDALRECELVSPELLPETASA